ncbi:HlyD family type I secretion periplasmic adaptor subunit [Sphingomonas ginkgonis]|uniref:Membrane fusion protein (MFP) family protein n=1 Tax=Sphingomonas ginkgonis TaxID=2315330 RepID=A0A3R9YPL8_9SPHN|nr:HlyD family type I secretion periplasmic adaptor subunit [Sphingomonas ginkgonis]
MPTLSRRSPALLAAPDPVRAAEPGGDIRAGLIILLLFFVLFLGWAALAPLDAVAIAPGRLAVSGERQTVQHPTGGVVASIHVVEGSRVRQGQVLVQLAAAETRGEERARAGQAIALLAQRARLQAEQSGQNMIVPPPQFYGLSGDDRVDAEQALALQRTQLATRRSVLIAQQRVLGQQVAQAASQGSGYDQRAGSIRRQIKLLDDELNSLRKVAAEGFVSLNRVRALERAKADLEGQLAQSRATVASSSSLAGQSRLEILAAGTTYQDRVGAELRDVNNALADALPKWEAARDQLNRAAIRAPATGTVVGLTVFTPGGVIGAGQKLMDIVPDRAPLTVEARVAPGDADDISAGQRTFVRFFTLHERALPALEGRVTRVSADAFTDERNGESYYTANIEVPLSELRQIEQLRGRSALRAGMPVSVEIPLRKRTALRYAFEPLTDSLRRSFTEH